MIIHEKKTSIIKGDQHQTTLIIGTERQERSIISQIKMKKYRNN